MVFYDCKHPNQRQDQQEEPDDDVIGSVKEFALIKTLPQTSLLTLFGRWRF